MIDIIYWQSVRSDIFRNVDYDQFLIIIGRKAGKINKKSIDFLNRIVEYFNSSENEYKNHLRTQIYHHDDIVNYIQSSYTYREFDNLVFNTCRKRFNKFCPRKERKVFINKMINELNYE